MAPDGAGKGSIVKYRLAFLSALAVLASVVVFASSAAAAPAAAAAPPTGGITSSIPCTVLTVPGTCQLTVTSFQVVNGVLTAVGTVSGGGITVPFQAPVQA